MKIHKGRLIDHLHLRVTKFADSRRFYSACLGALGLSIGRDTDTYFTFDELFVSEADDTPVSRVHLAFQASSEAEVAAFHRAALDAGGADNGKPGPRAYHPGYYAAYAFDPDGNNIEAVFHGPMMRSADSIVFTPPRSVTPCP